jgi:hypothetical protein
MALIWVEGFEGFGTTNGVAPAGYDGKYAAVNRVNLTDIQAGRIAGKSWYANTSSTPYWRTDDLGAATTVITGFGFKLEILNGSRTIFRCYEPSTTAGFEVRTTAGGELAAYRAGTLLGTSTGAGIKPGPWYYIEIKSAISNTAGTAIIKVNEVQVLNLSSQDTQVGATAEYRQYQLMGSAVFPHNFSFDDWYICDDSGSQNNDFLGSIRVDGILPDGDSGTINWTPSTGTVNSALVDENPHNTDTDYVESSTSTDQDLYDYAAVPTTLDTIHGLQINTIVRETDASDFTLKTLIYSGTTSSADSAQAIAGTSYETLYRISELDPDTTSAWTSSGINSAQFGIEVG